MDEDGSPLVDPDSQGCFPPLDVWAYPRPVSTEATLYGSNGAEVAALLTAALDLDGDDLWRIASAFDFDYTDRAQHRADVQRTRDIITLAAQATGRVDEVRLAFAAGERAAFYTSGPGMGSLDFWPMESDSHATAPVGYAAAALVVADALAPDDLDFVLRVWRARDSR